MEEEPSKRVGVERSSSNPANGEYKTSHHPHKVDPVSDCHGRP